MLGDEKVRRALLTGLNCPLSPFTLLLFIILEMVGVETPDNRATSAKDIPTSLKDGDLQDIACYRR